jgi:hypothetical protein
MNRRYAQGTTVSVEKSRSEIEKLLRRHGATQFISAWDEELGNARLMCKLEGKTLRFDVQDPNPEDFFVSEGGRTRNEEAVESACEKERMRRWRSLLLRIKAKLEAIADGMTTVEEEFLANLMLPDGSTVIEEVLPRLAVAYETGKMPQLLPGLPAPRGKR